MKIIELEKHIDNIKMYAGLILDGEEKGKDVREYEKVFEWGYIKAIKTIYGEKSAGDFVEYFRDLIDEGRKERAKRAVRKIEDIERSREK